MKRLLLLVFSLGLMQGVTVAQFAKPFDFDNGLLKVSVDLGSKTWSLFEKVPGGWRAVISSATVSIAFHDRDSLLLSNEAAEVFAKTDEIRDELGTGRKLDIRLDGPEARWAMSFVLYNDEKILTISASAANKSAVDWKPDRFHLLDVGGAGYLGFDTSNVLMQVNGYQSWSTSDIVRLDSTSRNRSFWSTVFYEPDLSYSLLAGFLTNSQSMNSISTAPMEMETGQLQISSSSDVRSLVVPPGGEIRSDRMILSFDPSPLDNLARYGEDLQLFAPAVNKPFTPTGRDPATRPGSLRVPAGWCSWYYYYQHITEDSILTNVNAAAKELKGAGLRYIQIDDGYQIAAGDWNTNGQFPHGHKWLVNKIHASGFLAGLWVAPFAVSESSSVYKHHRDWLLKDDGDTLKQFFANDWWGGRIYTLDPTRPEVQRWLEALFYKIVNEWGYDYVKIDFLYFPAEGGKYFRPMTSAQAYQAGLRAIRRGAGSEKFILGCGAPLGPSIGFLDGMRIGTDVYAAWGGITPGVNAAASRSFYHRSVWYDDPDCLVVRDPLTEDQARVWASVVALSGQMNLMSDKLTALPDDRLDLLRMTIPVYSRAAAPVDLFSEPKEQGLTISPDTGDASTGLPGRWKFAPGDSMIRKEPGFDDSGWKEIAVPAHWENEGYTGLDSIAWYRAKFSIPRGWKRGALRLRLGRIDDCDETYLNGTMVGKSGTFPPGYVTDWTSFRTYTVPEGAVNWEGENTIAIRVYDGGGPGGFYSIRNQNLPSVWNLPVSKEFGKWNVVGVFNWSNGASNVTVRSSQLGLSPVKSYLAYERWGEKYLGEFHGSLTLRMQPTSSQILSVHEKLDHPFILSTSRHITQGAVDLSSEEWSAKTEILSAVSGSLAGGSYSAVVYVPPGFEFKGVVTPSGAETTQLAPGVLKVTFPVGKKTTLSWKLRFNETASGR